jgi:cell division protein FtsW
MFSARRTDLPLLVITLVLVTIGLGMLYSTSAIMAQDHFDDSLYFLKRQIMWSGLGLVAMWIAASIPYPAQRRLALPAMGFVVLLLVLVLIAGKKVGGAQRWLALGAFSFQPSELAKHVLIMFVARVLAANSHRPESLLHIYLPNVITMGIVFGLVWLQPDLGTAVVLVASASLMLLIAGMPWRYLVTTAAGMFPLLYYKLFLAGYNLDRVLAFLQPWKDPRGIGYQIVQAHKALGRGGWAGVGLGQSQQKLFYLPESHTDFIFAIVGEELGLIGAFALIMLFVALLWRILDIAMACNEPFGSYLGFGIFFSMALQITMNLGVVSGLLPTKGMPLPFISHGGSNLLVSMLAVGTMLNIAGRKT